jgi:DNA-binding LacI/PurR family transcriptional regulator
MKKTNPEQDQPVEKTLSRDKRNREFLYHQLAEILRKDIEGGKFKPGERLPSMDDLSEQYSVNKVTVRRALAELNAGGYIYSVPAQGTYVAERTAKAPVRNHLLTVGLISHLMVPGNTGLYHMDIIQGIRDELSKLHANLVILPARHIEPQIKIYDHIVQAGLDAIIYLGMFEPQTLRQMVENGPPAVLVDYSLRGLMVDTILLDNRGGGYQAMEHLLALGHRSIGVILGSEEQTTTKERLEGALDAIEQAGLPKDIIKTYQSDFTREGGYQAMAEILRSNEVPTAIFCLNDEMATGALQALHSFSNLSVPRDISIMGFDDTAWATATQPPLTTIQVARTLMGRLAVQRIMARLKGQDQMTTTILPTQLVVRNSTTPPAAASNSIQNSIGS